MQLPTFEPKYEERDEPPFSYVQALPVQVNNAGLGWLVTLGRFNPPQPTGDLSVARDTYLSPDGSRHTFYPNLHEGEPIDPDFEYTRDGSYLRYRKSTRELEFPDGTVHVFEAGGYLTRDAGLVVRLANGSEFQITIVQSRNAADDDCE